jgi:hypothetical protein
VHVRERFLFENYTVNYLVAVVVEEQSASQQSVSQYSGQQPASLTLTKLRSVRYKNEIHTREKGLFLHIYTHVCPILRYLHIYTYIYMALAMVV